MRKRFISLLVLAIVIVVATAPVAMADHCRRCRNFTNCVIAPNFGFPFCDDSSGMCILSGPVCTGPHPLTEPEIPFAADFTVASVERLDESQPPAPTEPRVASLETTPNIR